MRNFNRESVDAETLTQMGFEVGGRVSGGEEIFTIREIDFYGSNVKLEGVVDEEEDTHTGEICTVSVAAFIDVYKPIKKKLALSVVSSGSDALAKLMNYPDVQLEYGRALVRIAMYKAVQLSADTVNVQIKLKPRRGVFALSEYKQGELQLVVFNSQVSIAKTTGAIPTRRRCVRSKV
jgi:hypothetical protein